MTYDTISFRRGCTFAISGCIQLVFNIEFAIDWIMMHVVDFCKSFSYPMLKFWWYLLLFWFKLQMFWYILCKCCSLYGFCFGCESWYGMVVVVVVQWSDYSWSYLNIMIYLYQVLKSDVCKAGKHGLAS